MGIINISGYAFTPLNQLDDLKVKLKDFCNELALKGSILLSEEGINVFLAGPAEAITDFHDALPRFGLPLIEFKKSVSKTVPFKKLLVRVKPEIITTRRLDITPQSHPASYLAPKALKAWLDEGKEVILLDTRNDYEVHLGKFASAMDCNIKSFHEFPEAIEQLDPKLKKKPIVTYCTGGIRCEKAAPILIEAGFEEVYQLEGGILNYFETCEDAHFEGECFVFDKRIAVDAQLAETETVQCFACRMPVTPEWQSSEKYIIGESCPFCFKELTPQ